MCDGELHISDGVITLGVGQLACRHVGAKQLNGETTEWIENGMWDRRWELGAWDAYL